MNTPYSATVSAHWIEDVIQFWFEELGPKGWFSGKAEIDAQIRDRFSVLHKEIAEFVPPLHDLGAKGALAALIVLDQFSRNIYRGDAKAFACDPAALKLAKEANALGFDAKLELKQRHFLYMPFMHAEDGEMQARSVALFEALGNEHLLPFAREHRDVIKRFGRFPARNVALCRESTDEEKAFLAEVAQ